MENLRRGKIENQGIGMSLAGLIKELFPKMAVKDVNKIILNYGDALRDILEVFLQDQIPYLDKLKNINHLKCDLCGRSKQNSDVQFIDLRDKQICLFCVEEAAFLVRGAIYERELDFRERYGRKGREYPRIKNQNKYDSSESTLNVDETTDLNPLDEALKEACQKGVDIDNMTFDQFQEVARKMASGIESSIKEHSIPFALNFKIEKDTVWVDIDSLIAFFLSDALPKNADIEDGVLILQTILKDIRKKVTTEKA